MAESILIPLAGVTAGAIGLVTVLFALSVRDRPAVLGGPLATGVSVFTITVGVAVLLAGEAAHGADALIYVGGTVALIGVGVLTAIVATVPHPEGEAETGH